MSRISEYNGADPNGTTSAMTYIHMTDAAYLSIVPIPSDGQYTIGFWIRATGQYTCNISIEESMIKEFDVYRDWTRIEHVFDADTGQQVSFYLPAGDYYIWHAKLESGNMATDYSPADQDVEDQIKTTEKNLRAEINITADSIRQEVSNTFKDYATTEEVKSAIEVSADSIGLSVDSKLEAYATTEEMNSAINISKDSIESTVAATQSKWDVSWYIDHGYTINYVYSDPTDGEPPQSEKIAYLDVNTGIIYDSGLKTVAGKEKYVWMESAVREVREVLESSIEQTTSEIVLKVDANGKIVEVALSADPKEGTTFTLDADNIDLTANDIFNIIARNELNLTSMKISIASKNFGVDEDGNMTCKDAEVSGVINANSLNIIKDNRWYGRMDFGSMTFSSSYEGMAGGSFSSCGIALVNTTYGSGDRYAHAAFGFLDDDGIVHVPFYVRHDSMAGDWNEGYYMVFGGTVGAQAYTNISTRLVKENVESLSYEEARKILDVNVVSFDYSHGGRKDQRGVIYEEVKDVIPSVAVCTDEDYEKHYRDGTDCVLPGVDYSKFVPYLIKMVQIQQEEIDELRKDLERISRL